LEKEMTNMAGQVVRLRNYRHYGTDGKSWAEYKHEDKNMVFVGIIVGERPKVDEDMTREDVELMMGDLGWKKMTEKQFRAHAKKRGIPLRED
jgi:hypothetical protein